MHSTRLRRLNPSDTLNENTPTLPPPVHPQPGAALRLGVIGAVASLLPTAIAGAVVLLRVEPLAAAQVSALGLGLIGVSTAIATGALLARNARRLQRPVVLTAAAAPPAPPVEDDQVRLRAVMEQLQDAVLIADRHGCIHAVNPAAEALFGVAPGALLGAQVDPFLPDVFKRAGSNRAERTRQIATSTGSGVRTRGARLDGATFPVDCSVNVIRDNHETSFAWVLRDASASVRAEAEREERRAELEALVHQRTAELEQLNASLLREADERRRAEDEVRGASQAKSEFLANMSHELRTPLNAIIGYAELIEEEAVEDGSSAVVPDIQRIRQSADHLLHLINDILDLSKIEAGKLRISIEPIHVPELIQSVLATVQPLAARNGNRLQLELEPRLHPLPADPTRLRQVLFNLLANACKFTQNGTITLRVTTQRRADHADLAFEVRDTGIGIDPSRLHELFEPFVQAEADTARRFGGTGLGLSIARRLCRLMGGDLTATSARGQGSTFTVLLPAQVVPVELLSRSRTTGTQTALPSRALATSDDDSTAILNTSDPELMAMLMDALDRSAPARPARPAPLKAPATAPLLVEEDMRAVTPGAQILRRRRVSTGGASRDSDGLMIARGTLQGVSPRETLQSPRASDELNRLRALHRKRQDTSS